MKAVNIGILAGGCDGTAKLTSAAVEIGLRHDEAADPILKVLSSRDGNAAAYAVTVEVEPLDIPGFDELDQCLCVISDA
jgi:hypothetical protein